MAHLRDKVIRGWEKIDESWRFALSAFAIARLFFTLWSWVIFTVQPVAVQNFELSNEPIVSIFKLENSETHVYRRDVSGNLLTFQAAGKDYLIDQQTGSEWDINTGKAIEGKYKGTALSTAKTNPSQIFPYAGLTPYPGVWLAMWQRFDVNWYLSIAEKGYGHIPGDVHFPPLYPVLMRVLCPLVGNLFLAGLLLSNIATLYVLKLLHELFHQWGESPNAARGLLFFVIYPTFFFCFSAYSEPVFMVTALLSFKAMRSCSWNWAGFWIFCAVLIRLQGVALFAPMLYLMWQDRPVLRKRDHWTGFLIAGISGFLYLYIRAQSATEKAIPFVESDLHARLVPPWQSYIYAVQTIFSGHATFVDILNWGIVTLVIVLLFWGWKKIPIEYTIYTAFSLLIIISRMVETQPLTSMSRYSLTFIPIFFLFGMAGENTILRRVVIYGFVLLNLYLSGQFFLWGWVG
jgi:hypothetical protein